LTRRNVLNERMLNQFSMHVVAGRVRLILIVSAG